MQKTKVGSSFRDTLVVKYWLLMRADQLTSWDSVIVLLLFQIKTSFKYRIAKAYFVSIRTQLCFDLKWSEVKQSLDCQDYHHHGPCQAALSVLLL